MDGFGAAWAVWKSQKQFNTNVEIEYVSARYGDEPPPLLSDKYVIIVDFSYSRDILLEINEVATSLLVIDHHKTAQSNCNGLDFAKFDMNKSGAVMTWEHFFITEGLPPFLMYIQDRDLWRFELDDSNAINTAMFSYPMNFELWYDKFYLNWIDNYELLKSEGEAILRDRQQKIDSLISGWAIERQNIAGYNVPCLNCPHWLASDVLSILAESEPFAISYSDSENQRTFQLRSTKDGIDVSEVAKKYGGGGHKHASGFVVDKPRVFDL